MLAHIEHWKASCSSFRKFAAERCSATRSIWKLIRNLTPLSSHFSGTVFIDFSTIFIHSLIICIFLTKSFFKIVPDFIYTDPETGPIWNQAFLLLTNSLRGNTGLTWPMYNVHRPMYSVWEEFVIRTSRDKMNAALLASHVPVCADDKTLLGWHSWENSEGITSVWYYSRS